MASQWGGRLACLGLMASTIGDTSQKQVLVMRPHRMLVITKQHSQTSGLELLVQRCQFTHLLPHRLQPRLHQHHLRQLQLQMDVAVGMRSIVVTLPNTVQAHLLSVKIAVASGAPIACLPMFPHQWCEHLAPSYYMESLLDEVLSFGLGGQQVRCFSCL